MLLIPFLTEQKMGHDGKIEQQRQLVTCKFIMCSCPTQSAERDLQTWDTNTKQQQQRLLHPAERGGNPLDETAENRFISCASSSSCEMSSSSCYYRLNRVKYIQKKIDSYVPLHKVFALLTSFASLLHQILLKAWLSDRFRA
jgi:hypothetical protein